MSLLESGLTKAPMVIGNLKPVILMPIGLLTALTTAEVEAILVHELAHIKRRDYLVNLLQSLMEIVFFFNPAVLWVSQLIKAERENCCDDLAPAQSSDKVSYVRALLSCEEYQQSVPAYVMAFPGGNGSLFDRVKRIAGNRNHSLNLLEKTMLAICLVVSGLCMSAYAEKENIKRTVHEVVRAIQHIKGEVAPSPQSITKQTQLAENQKIQQANPLILSAEMPTLHDAVTTQIPDTDAIVHSKPGSLSPLSRLSNDSTNFINAKARWKNAVNEMVKDGLIKNRDNNSYHINENEFIINGVKQPEDVRVKYLQLFQTPVTVNKNVDTKINVNADVKINVNTNVDYRLDTLRNSSSMNFKSKNGERSTYNTNTTMLYKPSRVTYSTTAPYKPDTANKKSIYNKYPIELRRKVTGEDKGKFRRTFDSLGKIDNKLELNKLRLKLNIPNIADALYNAGLIKDKTKFTGQLTNDALIVNGVKQSEANHQLILKKYQKKPGDTVNLSFTYPGEK
ncbi:M56 family metallopeptidase [Mucilaginibacter humi]|uniref:M56 family metallopeptidase n=1 Tax=Mucilaginibacter humi TaxID=2732510 RepID=UPI00293BA971|nr:M56 family metallopeptidase [Mucilaginibacter humi]